MLDEDGSGSIEYKEMSKRLKQAQDLMAALVVEHADLRLFWVPADLVDRPGVGGEFGVEVDPLSGGDFEDCRMWSGDPVARLEVLVGLQDRFDLVFRHDLEQVDRVFLG